MVLPDKNVANDNIPSTGQTGRQAISELSGCERFFPITDRA
jgi:hypothetical protein